MTEPEPLITEDMRRATAIARAILSRPEREQARHRLAHKHCPSCHMLVIQVFDVRQPCNVVAVRSIEMLPVGDSFWERDANGGWKLPRKDRMKPGWSFLFYTAGASPTETVESGCKCGRVYVDLGALFAESGGT